MLFLNKDSGQVVVLGREGHLLSAHSSDEAVGGGLAEFYGLDQVKGDTSYMVYPFKRGVVACSLVVDPVVSLEVVKEGCWLPRDAGNDDVPTCSVDDVGVHPKSQEALPLPVFRVP